MQKRATRKNRSLRSESPYFMGFYHFRATICCQSQVIVFNLSPLISFCYLLNFSIFTLIILDITDIVNVELKIIDNLQRTTYTISGFLIYIFLFSFM